MWRSRRDRGVGLLAVLPAAMVGLLGLTDGTGPAGWRGIAELVGLFTTCRISAGLFAFLLARGRQVDASAYSLALAAVAGMGMLAYRLLYWLGTGAPMSAKITFTSSMQVIGVLTAVRSMVLLANRIWKPAER